MAHQHHTSCKKLVSVGQQQQEGAAPARTLFALVHAHRRSLSFDVALTDGQHAWSGQGLKPSKPPGFSEDEAWARTAELLAEDDASISRPAALAITEADNGDLQLSWRWDREVGAGRHVLKLPQQLASGPQQPLLPGQPPALSKQQQPQATIVRILDTLVTSYSKLQAAVRVSSDAQASLAVSLEAMRATVDSQAAANKARERELYLKFTMLLNQKTRQLQKEHELAKQLAQELEHIKGEAEADTDDEEQMRQQAADQAAGGDGAATDPEPDDSEDGAGGGGGGGGGAAAFVNLLGETQMLPEEELAQWQP